jgi:glycoside/pentoside/hexuronide:cation symporter, GPH family
MSSNSTPSSEKLTVKTKLAYGVGDLAPAIVAGVNGFLLNAFLLDVVGLRPGLVGTIFLIAKIWDAINDPIMGFLTDHTKSRWGRRRPWLLFAAVPFALTFFMQWLVPPVSEMAKFWYYLVVAIFLDAAFTAVNVPYAALTPELTHDYDERTSLSSYRLSFSILGGVLAVFFHSQIVTAVGNVYTGNAIAAACWAFLILGSNWITFFFTRERNNNTPTQNAPVQAAPSQAEPGFWKGMRIVFNNKAFVMVSLIYLLSWLAIQFVQNNLLLYVKYWVGAESYFGFLVLGVQISAFLFLLMWAKISSKIGKQNIYYIGMAFWVIVEIALFFVQPGQVTLLFVLALLAGAGVSIGYLVPWSMIPDVIELDELETGVRREGIFYGFFVFLQKMGISLGLALSNYILELTGYINQVVGGAIPVQPAPVLLSLRIFVSIAPAVILLLSFYVVYKYPITRKKHAEMRAEIDRRKALASSIAAE